MRFNKVKAVFFFIFLFHLCCCLSTLSYADTLDTQLSRDQIALGETVILSFNLNNSASYTSPDFSPFEKDFHIIGTNHRTVINILNGVTRALTVWQVTLEPKMAGELMIPAINFGSTKSTPRKLVVNKTVAVTPSDPQSASAFAQAEVNTAAPYVQSQVLYTFKLFYRTQLENPRMEPPHINEATLIQIGEDKYYQTTLKGERYLVFEKNFAIFPQKPGKLSIPPTLFRAIEFDSLTSINDPFSIPTTRRVTLTTQSFALDVKKIPANFRAKVWLPAKNISLTENWSSAPNQWEIGNPITRTITIEAQGLRADQLPDLSIDKISGVNIYADPPHRSNSVQGNSLVGTWQQKITYIPNRSQSFSIPALQLNWWNIQTNRNVLAQLKLITVQVRAKPTPLNTSLAASTQAPTHIAKSVAEINKATTQPPQNPAPSVLQQTPTEANKTSHGSIWFWTSIFLFMLWLITIGLSWKKTVSNKLNFTEKDNRSVVNTERFRDKTFAQACEQGDSLLAQKLLLMWATTQWQDPPRNLSALGERFADENFKRELKNLEQALYADKLSPWNGRALLAAYQSLNKVVSHHTTSSKARRFTDKSVGPLPPLHPN